MWSQQQNRNIDTGPASRNKDLGLAGGETSKETGKTGEDKGPTSKDTGLQNNKCGIQS